MQAQARVESFPDPVSGTVSYVVLDEQTRTCAIIDPVMGYDTKSGRTDFTLPNRLVARVKELEGKVDWILETHVHADHLSAASYLRETLRGKLAISENILEVQQFFGTLFNEGESFWKDGRQFDYLFNDGVAFNIGSLKARVLHTPGHTPACVTYLIESTDGSASFAFVGDTMFMPDCGTARCDFPGGDARTLYQSIRKILALPSSTQLYMCHDYPPAGRTFANVCTVGDQRSSNIHVRDGISEAEFVAMRTARDATLAMPDQFIPSIQINMRGGEQPPPEPNGIRYLKIPLNAF